MCNKFEVVHSIDLVDQTHMLQVDDNELLFAAVGNIDRSKKETILSNITHEQKFYGYLNINRVNCVSVNFGVYLFNAQYVNSNKKKILD